MWEGGAYPGNSTTSGPLPKYWHFASTTCRRCLQVADSVHLGTAGAGGRDGVKRLSKWGLGLSGPCT